MSSAGFLISSALTSALRKPYHKGDHNITLLYLVEGIKIGAYRVLLKRNFDTACWVPPAGKRDSHTIYYGDRMLDRIFDRYVRLNAVPLPDMPALIKLAQHEKYTRALDEAFKDGAALAIADKDTLKVTKSELFDTKVTWLKDNLKPEQWDELSGWILNAVVAYGRHEREHALNTPQDLKAVSAELRMFNIPFDIFNLFEDARIEQHSRNSLGDRFGWTDFEDLCPPTDPTALFLRCIQLEGDDDTEALENETMMAKRTLSVGEAAERVREYYQRTCAAKSASHLTAIMLEFLTEFKEELAQDPSAKSSGAPGGKPGGSGSEGEDADSDDEDDSDVRERAGDLSTAAEAAEKGDEFFEEFEKDAEIVGGTDEEGKAADAKATAEGKDKKPSSKASFNPNNGGMGEHGSVTPTETSKMATEDEFLSRLPSRMDSVFENRLSVITAKLLRLFKSHTLPSVTEAPGKRMSGRHLAKNEIRYIDKRTFGGKGKRKYAIVFDCSGSMSGHPTREGKLFLLALNNLAKRGFLTGSVILSGLVGSGAQWLRYELPLKDEVILRIQPGHGGEGLQGSLKDNLKHLKGMDDVFVFTDAHITDVPIKRDMFTSQRIIPVGLYAGPATRAGHMSEHFPQNIIRDTIEEIVDAMLIRNTRRK